MADINESILRAFEESRRSNLDARNDARSTIDDFILHFDERRNADGQIDFDPVRKAVLGSLQRIRTSLEKIEEEDRKYAESHNGKGFMQELIETEILTSKLKLEERYDIMHPVTQRVGIDDYIWGDWISSVPGKGLDGKALEGKKFSMKEVYALVLGEFSRYYAQHIDELSSMPRYKVDLPFRSINEKPRKMDPAILFQLRPLLLELRTQFPYQEDRGIT